MPEDLESPQLDDAKPGQGQPTDSPQAANPLSPKHSKPVKQKAAYTETTDRILALSQLMRAIAPFIWAVVILVVLVPLMGRGVITHALFQSPPAPPQEVVVEVVRPTDASNLDQAIVSAVQDAHQKAEAYAAGELDAWVETWMVRVDNSFLDWYFGYFNQKKLEFSAPFVWLSAAVVGWTDDFIPWGDANNLPPAQKVAEKFTEDFQTEFAKRVLLPQTAQLRLEQLTQNTINLYVDELNRSLTTIQGRYRVPQADWERYLGDIAITIRDTEGSTSNLSLKVLAGGGTYLLAKPLIGAFVGKVGSKVVATFGGKAAAGLAAKTGGAAAAKVGVQFLDPIVGIGIFIWDVWDHHHTVQLERPILRQNLYEYLQLMERSLLTNPDNGIMAAINQLEREIYHSLDTHPAGQHG